MRTTAITAPTQFVEVENRRLAWRSIGSEQDRPIVLCNRFRGTLDLWDPAFIDGLAAQGLRVILFDYSGLGLSTGERTYSPIALAKDAMDLIKALGLPQVVIGGWSVGGIAAQIVLASLPQRISHAVLIATTPPGPLVKPGEQLFYDTALKLENDLDDFTVLFFEPASEASRAAARRSADRIAQRIADRSPPVPGDWASTAIGDKPRNPAFPAPAILEMLKTTKIPVLHIGGDHDIVFPVENWYALNAQLPTLQLLTLPRAGHGPQHQYPEVAAGSIGSFVRDMGLE